MVLSAADRKRWRLLPGLLDALEEARTERDEARAEVVRYREALVLAEALIATELEPHESEPEGVSLGVDATRFVLKQARALLEPPK